MELDYKKLGRLLWKIREEQGYDTRKKAEIKSRQLFGKSGFGESLIDSYEKANARIPLHRLVKLAKVYRRDYIGILEQLESDREIIDISNLPKAARKIIYDTIEAFESPKEEIEHIIYQEPPDSKQQGS